MHKICSLLLEFWILFVIYGYCESILSSYAIHSVSELAALAQALIALASPSPQLLT
jgi:hypothetical protein